MKKIILLLSLFCLTISQTSAFDDIENNWYKESINEFKELELISSDNKNFEPHNTISRSEILKIILGASKIETLAPEKSCFSDVKLNSWQTKYVCSGIDKGITKGYSDGTFKPGGKVSVLETLAFGTRAFGFDVGETKEGEEWYEKYQKFADETDILAIHSYTVNTLISRGQAVGVINKMRKFSQEESIDNLSIGCEIVPNLQSGLHTISVGGVKRSYLLYVPSGMKQGKETKLAVAFHGRTNNNKMVRDYMQLGGGSYGYKQNDFVVAYPAGVGKGPYSWSQHSNIEFFDAIITEVSENLCIDRQSVFSVGHSLGSHMSNKVSCQRGDVIRAMAGVASDGFKGECTGPVASLITHLAGDPLAAYSGGRRAYKIRSSVNLCSDDEKKMSIGDLKSCTQKLSCSPGNPVVFCNSYATYGSDQHSWPKKGSDDILDFFRNIDNYVIE